MTVAMIELSDSLRTLIDSRLDTIERMLLGRMPRQERLAIVREVESQIFELLQERGTEELARDDLLAVFAQLDPPEAFLPDDGEDARTHSRQPTAHGSSRLSLVAKSHLNMARASGVLGLVAIAFTFLIPISLLATFVMQTDAVLYIGGGGSLLSVLVSGLPGLILGVIVRKSGAWAILGIVASALALALSIVMAGVSVALFR